MGLRLRRWLRLRQGLRDDQDPVLSKNRPTVAGGLIVEFIVSVGILVVAAASLFGWGEQVRRMARMPALAWPTTIGLGLGTVLAIGGLVNVARIAFAMTLWIVAG